MRFTFIREILPSGSQATYFSYESYRAQRLATALRVGGEVAWDRLQRWFIDNDQIERVLESDFNLRHGSATGLLLILKDEGEARDLLADPNVVSLLNCHSSSASLVMCSAWRFNSCRITSANFDLHLHYASQPHNFNAARA